MGPQVVFSLMGSSRTKLTHSIVIGTSQGSEPSVTSNSVACWLDPQRRARLAAQPQSRPRFRRHIFTNTSASLDSCLTDLLSDSKICPPRPSRCSSPSPTHCQPSCATQKPPWIYTTVRLVHISCVTSFVHSWRRLSPPVPASQNFRPSISSSIANAGRRSHPRKTVYTWML